MLTWSVDRILLLLTIGVWRAENLLTRIDHPERNEVAESLQVFIAEGDYAPGDRIPSERRLIEILGISRTAMRRALDHLERSGVIWRHVGKGTFVSHGSDDTGNSDTFAELSHQLTPLRMMRARLCIEPAIAREAAINASKEALLRITGAAKMAREAQNWADYERHDDQFHRAVALAADNDLLLAVFESVNRVRREVAGATVTRSTKRPTQQHSSFVEHEAIIAALEAHDPDAAYRGMRQHLQSVAYRLFEEN
jgi:DNA-binding FadR family transcriptional regulator